MRPYPTSSQSHIPQVYHHTEQRGSNPSDRVNVTTYVFQTNRNVPPPSRGKHHPHMFRSMTPQPTATYYSEDRQTIRARSFGRPATNAPTPNSGSSQYLNRPYHPHTHTDQPGGAHHMVHYEPDNDNIDDSHLQSVRASAALFERKPWKTDNGPNFSAGPNRFYSRHTSRVNSSSAPPGPGRYDYRPKTSSLETQRFGNYEVIRAVAGAPPMSLELSPGSPSRTHVVTKSIPYGQGPTSPPMPKPHPSRSTTMPTYQRFLSHDSATSSHPQDAGNGYDNGAFDSRHPPWYGSLRSSRDPNNIPAHQNPMQHSPPQNQNNFSHYGTLPRGSAPRSKSSNPIDRNHGGRNTGEVFLSPTGGSSFNQPRSPKGPRPQIHYFTPQALKQSVTSAAAHKLQSGGGGLLKPSGGAHQRNGGLFSGAGGGGYPPHRSHSDVNLHNGMNAYPSDVYYY